MSGVSADYRSKATPVDSVPVPKPRAARTVRALTTAARYLVGGVFLLAALSKITDLAGFEDRLILRGELPAWVVWPLVYILPWLELTCGLCLVLRYAVREAALLTCLLLAAFLVFGLWHGSDADCGCLLIPGLPRDMPAWWFPVRDGVLLTLAGWVCYQGGEWA